MFILSFRFQEYDQECIYIHFSGDICYYGLILENIWFSLYLVMYVHKSNSRVSRSRGRKDTKSIQLQIKSVQKNIFI